MNQIRLGRWACGNRTVVRSVTCGAVLILPLVLARVCVAGGREAQSPEAIDIETIVPTSANPVAIPEDDKPLRSELTRRIDQYMSLPAEQVKAHPAAADFPGNVASGAVKVNREVDVALNLPRWHSTGLYAAPGEKITIRVSPADAARGLSIELGCHTDHLNSLKKWVRFPRITRRFAIKEPVTTVANAFGGLIYIDAPRDPALGGAHFGTYGGYGWLDEKPSAVSGVAHVRIEGAVEAPLFVLGRTTPKEWKRQLQSAAPWGELASVKIVLTVQTSRLASIPDPAALLRFWDSVVDAEAELAGWPRQPAPPERIVVDREISAGWMHSGYPVMAHLQSEAELLNLPGLKTKGDWGYFHELGHNHEGQAYTFGSDYVEVDVNLFSMYVMQNLVGREMTAHPALAHLDKLMELRLGPEKKSDAWGNLFMYIETIKAFGWEPLEKTLASYARPGGAEGIRTREQKMDQWVLRYSRATGKNLVPYYELFDVTCSDETKAALKGLPVWIPPEMERYAKKS